MATVNELMSRIAMALGRLASPALGLLVAGLVLVLLAGLSFSVWVPARTVTEYRLPTAASQARTTEGSLLEVARTTTTGPPSDTLALGLVGMGAVLILAAAFFDRLREVNLPGGGGLKVAAPEEIADAVTAAAKVARESGKPVTEAEIAAAAARVAGAVAVKPASDSSSFAARRRAALEQLARAAIERTDGHPK